MSLRSVSLYVLYAGGSLRTRQALFVLDHKHGEPPFAHGGFQPGVVPRFLKVRLEPGRTRPPSPPTAWRPASTSCSPRPTRYRACLLGTFTRTPGQADLSARPASSLIN